jgi:hypothetical protein
VALCADIDGLFVDLPPRPRERFTLVGCVPGGALALLLNEQAHQDGGGRMDVAGQPVAVGGT